VEDEKDERRIIAEMLRGRCELSLASTLAEARLALESEDFSLVLLDIGLPDGNGLELLDLIEKKTAPPRVVIFSARDIPPEYAERTDAVLVKSKTNNQELLSILLAAMR